MGFESFQVTLSGGPFDPTELDEVIRSLPGMRPDPEEGFMRGSYYVFEDGRHVVELHLSHEPVDLSCRFTLCHPDSIYSSFIGLLRLLVSTTGMEVTIRDDVRPEHNHAFPPSEFSAFAACLPGYIAVRRADWIAGFGAERIAASSVECFQRIILPRCQPLVVQS